MGEGKEWHVVYHILSDKFRRVHIFLNISLCGSVMKKMF